MTKETFEVIDGENRRTFTDASAAGAAFFATDPKNRPVVVHSLNDRSARVMANTMAATDEDHNWRYWHALPYSHAVDRAFSAGYTAALMQSVTARLKNTDWAKVHPAPADKALVDDLKRLFKLDAETARGIWVEHGPPGMALAVFIEREGRETTATGATGVPARRYGRLAQQALGLELEPQVMKSAAGYYIGTRTPDGLPGSRESNEYWRTQKQAVAALQTGQWSQAAEPLLPDVPPHRHGCGDAQRDLELD